MKDFKDLGITSKAHWIKKLTKWGFSYSEKLLTKFLKNPEKELSAIGQERLKNALLEAEKLYTERKEKD